MEALELLTRIVGMLLVLQVAVSLGLWLFAWTRHRRPQVPWYRMFDGGKLTWQRELFLPSAYRVRQLGVKLGWLFVLTLVLVLVLGLIQLGARS
jgi:hypothetical protein